MDDINELKHALRKMMLRKEFLNEIGVRVVHERIDGTGYVFADDHTPASPDDYEYYTRVVTIFDAQYDVIRKECEHADTTG